MNLYVAWSVTYINLQRISERAKVAAQIVLVLGRARGGIQKCLESNGGVGNTYWLLNEAPSIHKRMKSCFVSIVGTIGDCPGMPKDRQGCAKHSDTPTEAPGSVGDFRSSQRLLAKRHRALEASSIFLMWLPWRPILRRCPCILQRERISSGGPSGTGR